jgi:hypothetical protein
MRRSKYLARILSTLSGACVGAVFGFFAGIALCEFVYRDTGAGVAGGGDGIETVLAGYALYGLFGAISGAWLGGVASIKAFDSLRSRSDDDHASSPHVS